MERTGTGSVTKATMLIEAPSTVAVGLKDEPITALYDAYPSDVGFAC